MVKELRTSAVQLKLHRQARIDGTAWDLRNVQPFFPPLETLFKTDKVSSLQDYGVRTSDDIESVVDADHIKVSKGKVVPIHRKTTMILSPFKWMRGDYGALGLPKPEDVASDMQEKLQSPHTAGYVGAMCSIALSESGCIHFPKVYGVYTALAAKHTLDVSDDYEDLSDRRWFAENLGKTFELKLRQTDGQVEFMHTRSQRPGLQLGEETDLGELITDVDADHVSEPSERDQSESHEEGDSDYGTDSMSESNEDEFEIRSCDCGSDVSDEEEEEECDEEPFAWATFKDVPVITTVMEKCEGTFYDLVKTHSQPEKHAAWVAQIVFALSYAQRNYGFTHNDLHGNNVMYVPTDQTHLFYKHNGVCYRVPTFGYVMKIIDFDRAIFSLRLNGMKESRQFVSSQFQADDEAAGQYNIEPFFNTSHPRIAPNPSFDLCRFATSMFWDMFPEGPDHAYTHPLFEVFKQWMLQSDGTSVFFREQMDRHDRYHGFDLYKAIARYCKDSATPRRELAKLTAFATPSVPLGTPCLFLEA
jgi:hypothetical protein